jgi:cell wall-associated NlpC family hydrolase
MKRFFLALGLSICGLLAAEVRTCQRPVVNMHAQPTRLCEVVSQVCYATPVEVLAEENGWTLIQTPDQYQGWVWDRTLHRTPEVSILPITTTARVKHLFAHVYREPDITTCAPLMTLPYGVAVEVLSDVSPRWLMVQLVDGTNAYVQRGDLELAPVPLTLVQMLSESRQFVGLPYTWGGTSSFGFDCSGLVQMLYGLMGIQLPRDAKLQWAMEGMTPVALEQLVPGDFIFFNFTTSSGTKGYHVGLYLGDNQFLHACARGGNPIVQIGDVTDPVWSQLYDVVQGAHLQLPA